jgi:oxygen-independent coproporphyrinogen III oxidase
MVTQNPGLYIHIPFCKTKCPYCAFYSVVTTSLIPRYVSALEKEIVLYKEDFDRFDTLYIGGGTPTSLDIKDLEKIIDHIFKNLSFAHDSEISIEANPGDLNREKIKGLIKLGFNRINVGAQSFNDKDLMFLGRRHTALECKNALQNLRTLGFDNVGLDLMYELEGQTLKDWLETLNQAIKFKPEHLSCYELTFEQGTPFWKKKEQGKIKPLPEEMGREFFLSTSEFLEANGYIHYEISNFAREGAFYSRHNWKYWKHIPYLGLGPSAHSFKDASRWWNFRSIRKYCDALENKKVPVDGRENLTKKQLQLESVSLGLRTNEGVDMGKISNTKKMRNRISELQNKGFITREDQRIIPTKKGFLVADTMPLYLLPD